MNCSIDLDARELERKRTLGSAGRTGDVFAGNQAGPSSPNVAGVGARIFPSSRIRESQSINPTHQQHRGHTEAHQQQSQSLKLGLGCTAQELPHTQEPPPSA
jgi:hypothetical protein